MLAVLQTLEGSAAQELELIAERKAAGLLVFEAREDIEGAEKALRTVARSACLGLGLIGVTVDLAAV